MPFDANQEADKIVNIARDMFTDNVANRNESTCKLASEWMQLSPNEKNETWTAMQEKLPTDTLNFQGQHSNQKSQDDHVLSMFGPVVIGHEGPPGQINDIDFKGPNNDVAGVLGFQGENGRTQSALAYHLQSDLRADATCDKASK